MDHVGTCRIDYDHSKKEDFHFIAILSYHLLIGLPNQVVHVTSYHSYHRTPESPVVMSSSPTLLPYSSLERMIWVNRCGALLFHQDSRRNTLKKLPVAVAGGTVGVA
jgi:hypothetical protein